MNNDINILRDLAKKVAIITSDEFQESKRIAWSNSNSFVRTTPLIYMRAYAFHECFDENDLQCKDALFRQYELRLQKLLFHDTLNDDLVLEPWLTLPSIYKSSNWGVDVSLGEKPIPHGAAAYKPCLNSLGDIDKLVGANHEIDEDATMTRYNKLNDAIGDIITIDLDRGSQYRVWSADLSTDLAKLRGLEQIMWDAYDNPEWLHKLLTFMRDTVLKNHKQVEDAGDWSLLNNENQAVAYANELERPKPNVYNKKMKEIWGYLAAQEYTTFSPMMFNEFMLDYQIPILEQFGLSAYGCCEDLTNKIDVLRKIKNLRRIAVSPFADAKRCAEQIGPDYILSWRPNPSSMIATGLDEAFVRKHMRENFKYFKDNNTFFDITLKDVETINNQRENVAKWVQIVREEIDRAGF